MPRWSASLRSAVAPPAPEASSYGYVNRVIADDQLDDEVDQIASRRARFDHDAIARTKSYVDQVTLPADSELPPALADLVALLDAWRRSPRE